MTTEFIISFLRLFHILHEKNTVYSFNVIFSKGTFNYQH